MYSFPFQVILRLRCDGERCDARPGCTSVQYQKKALSGWVYQDKQSPGPECFRSFPRQQAKSNHETIIAFAFTVKPQMLLSPFVPFGTPTLAHCPSSLNLHVTGCASSVCSDASIAIISVTGALAKRPSVMLEGFRRNVNPSTQAVGLRGHGKCAM